MLVIDLQCRGSQLQLQLQLQQIAFFWMQNELWDYFIIQFWMPAAEIAWIQN